MALNGCFKQIVTCFVLRLHDKKSKEIKKRYNDAMNTAKLRGTMLTISNVELYLYSIYLVFK